MASQSSGPRNGSRSARPRRWGRGGSGAAADFSPSRGTSDGPPKGRSATGSPLASREYGRSASGSPYLTHLVDSCDQPPPPVARTAPVLIVDVLAGVSG